jgi:nucleotide-binding universal stress UspA family protein
MEQIMSDKDSSVEYIRALEDFRRARVKARLQHLWAAVTGHSESLLPYDEITKRLRASGISSKGIQDIPVESIVGSVNRYQDFNKNFLPLREVSRERWARVKSAMTSPGSIGLPPIRVYKVGDAYFVLDGNHRVSIARQMGIETLEAYVTEIKTRVPLSAEDDPEDIILKAEYTQFLEETDFDEIIHDEELRLTFPGQYETLKEHIRVHRYYMGIEQSREISWEEAVRHWYTQVYQPVVEIIRDQDILEEFPDRTETDLYIWVLDHQTYMQEELGWAIRPEKAASDLVKKQSMRTIRVARRFGRKILRTLLPKQLEDFSSPGEWRKDKSGDGQPLFSDILVAMSGTSESWIALEQAIILGELEGSEIRGLLVDSEPDKDIDSERFITQVFQERLNQANLQGNFVFTEGSIAETICERVEVNDLLVLKLSHPPSKKIFPRLSSGLRMILRKSSRPVLAVKGQVSTLNHLMAVFDGSQKGKEALFLSAYFAKRYDRKFSVLVMEGDMEQGQALVDKARDILGEDCCENVLRKGKGDPAETIINTAAEINADLILMGGYRFSPIVEAIFGSNVNAVLRGTYLPVLVCQ